MVLLVFSVVYFLISILVTPASLVAQRLKHLPPMQETWVRSLGWEGPLEKAMAPHSSTLAWRIPWTEEPGRLQSTGLQRVRHDWAISPSLVVARIIQSFYLSQQVSICLLCVGPWDSPVCGSNCSFPRTSVHQCGLLFLLSPFPSALVPTWYFSSYHFQLCVYLTALLAQESFCWFPVSFPWELLNI